MQPTRLDYVASADAGNTVWFGTPRHEPAEIGFAGDRKSVDAFARSSGKSVTSVAICIEGMPRAKSGPILPTETDLHFTAIDGRFVAGLKLPMNCRLPLQIGKLLRPYDVEKPNEYDFFRIVLRPFCIRHGPYGVQRDLALSLATDDGRESDWLCPRATNRPE